MFVNSNQVECLSFALPFIVHPRQMDCSCCFASLDCYFGVRGSFDYMSVIPTWVRCCQHFLHLVFFLLNRCGLSWRLLFVTCYFRFFIMLLYLTTLLLGGQLFIFFHSIVLVFFYSFSRASEILDSLLTITVLKPLLE